jgi:hypothetical protein
MLSHVMNNMNLKNATSDDNMCSCDSPYYHFGLLSVVIFWLLVLVFLIDKFISKCLGKTHLGFTFVFFSLIPYVVLIPFAVIIYKNDNRYNNLYNGIMIFVCGWTIIVIIGSILLIKKCGMIRECYYYIICCGLLRTNNLDADAVFTNRSIFVDEKTDQSNGSVSRNKSSPSCIDREKEYDNCQKKEYDNCQKREYDNYQSLTDKTNMTEKKYSIDINPEINQTMTTTKINEPNELSNTNMIMSQNLPIVSVMSPLTYPLISSASMSYITKKTSYELEYV